MYEYLKQKLIQSAESLEEVKLLEKNLKTGVYDQETREKPDEDFYLSK